MDDPVETQEPKGKRGKARSVPSTPQIAAQAAKAGTEAIEAAASTMTSAVAETAEAAPAAGEAVQAAGAATIAALSDQAERTDAAVSAHVSTDSAAAAARADEGIEEMATVINPSEGFDKGHAMFGDMTARFKTAFEKSTKMSEELVDFTKGNVEALVASARVAAKASESLGQEAAEYGKKHLENATAAFKSFASVKSPTELFQLQSEFAKSSFDSAVAEASRMSESLLKVAGEIAQPISNRYAVAAEKFKAATL